MAPVALVRTERAAAPARQSQLNFEVAERSADEADQSHRCTGGRQGSFSALVVINTDAFANIHASTNVEEEVREGTPVWADKTIESLV